MKDRIERNFQAHAEQEARKGNFVSQDRLFEVSEEQRRLTEKFLLPYKREILKDAAALRTVVDGLVKEKRGDSNRATVYPVGYCFEITDEFLTQLHGEVHDRSKIGLTAIKNFIRAGGIVNHFWAIHKGGTTGDTFQNAIQLGSAVLDVAQDTLDGKGERVAFFKSFEESPLVPVDSYEQAAEVVESYWEEFVFPNIYLPELAPFYPMLTARVLKNHKGKPSGYSGIFILDSGISGQMDIRNWTTEDAYSRRMGYAYRFLTQSKWAKRRLPVEYVSWSEKNGRFLKSLKESDHEVFSVSFDAARLEDTFSRFYVHADSAQIYQEQLSDILNIRRLGKHFMEQPLFVVPSAKIKKAVQETQER